MNDQPERIIVTSMHARTMGQWKKEKAKKRIPKKTAIYLSAAILCLSVGTYALSSHPEPSKSVMSVMTTGFEYDETLGRLQYVSNMLPESAMVFLSSETDVPDFVRPTDADVLHVWSEAEPWIEYDASGSIRACEGGEVMTVVKNRSDEYTVRVMHDGGYESIYSGLTDMRIEENQRIEAGNSIGSASGIASFELRKDGMSVLPVFGEGAET